MNIVVLLTDREDSQAALDGELAATGLGYTLHETSTDPASQVIRLINELHAELAVVGLRNRSATSR